MSNKARTCWRRWGIAALSLVAATAVWLPCLHLFFVPDDSEYVADMEPAPKTAKLAAFQLKLWQQPEKRRAELQRMRRTNAEWDFMGRTFLVLSLANQAIEEPSRKAEYLDVVDLIIDETLALKKENGIYFFLMDYARAKSFQIQPANSLFVDGEIALMLAARRLVAEREEYRQLLRTYVDRIVPQMKENPLLMGESYPDECWTFCNTIAIAAVKISDHLDGRDHSAFIAAWLESMKTNFMDRETGLLVSSYTFDGEVLDGPEGSTIWTVAHFLKLLDPQFATDQYKRAKGELGASFFGFGYAKEWPASRQGPMDVDSGPVIPLFEASAGSSGQALLGAVSFDDERYLQQLLTSLHAAAMPIEKGGRMHFAASNQVGDAVILYALTQGPLWDKLPEPETEAME